MYGQVEEDNFSNVSNSKNIECIIPSSELLINFRVNGMRAKKPCYVYAEKMDFKGLIQLRLTEKTDQRRMYITTVDSVSFAELKQEQSLHVTFGGFIDNLVNILQDCQAGKLEMSIVESQQSSNRIDSSTTSVDLQLQFVEMRSFKNLVHLSLPCHMAPLNVVLFYMNTILDGMQKKILNYEQTSQQLQIENNAHLRRIENLESEKVNMRESHSDSIRMLHQRHAEDCKQIQDSLRKVSEQRENDNDRNKKTISSLQIQIDQLITEKTNLQTEKSKEQKRCDFLKEELDNVKSKGNNIKDLNEKHLNEISSLRNSERKLEMLLSDAKKQITDLQEKLKRYDKTKADIIAGLEAEKKISQTKRQALEMATEEISKANKIILKQNQEIVKHKNTIEWRTEVALQQEKAINEKEQLLKLRENEVNHFRVTLETLRKEIPTQLQSMRIFAHSLEEKYSEQIKALKVRLSDKENCPPQHTK